MLDEGDLAQDLAEVLQHTEFFQNHGWKAVGYNFGQIDIETGDGQKFELSVELIGGGDHE